MNLDEEKLLWSAYKEKNDISARDVLIVHHTRIVKYIAGRMAIHVPQNIEMNDLVGWGMLGLMDAVEKYDHRQDIKFTTYASIRIRGAIIDEIRSLDWAPRSLRSMARRIVAAKEKIRHQKAGEASVDEIAEELGVPTEQVEDAITQVQTAQVLSLDDYLPSEDNADARKINTLGNPAAPSPDMGLHQQERQERLVQAILQLSDQQQRVLNLYYYQELTLKEIGAVLDVSESRVCQIHGAAMKALRRVMQGAVDASAD